MKAWALLALLFAGPSLAHDSWISRESQRNAAGEWCCGAGDCLMMDDSAVEMHADGYHVSGEGTLFGFIEFRMTIDPEIVPLSEAQPSPDGRYWRCMRPDRSRRCFFAPPPAM